MLEKPIANFTEKDVPKQKRKNVTGRLFEGTVQELYELYSRYRSLYELATIVNAYSDLEDFFDALLDKIIDLTGAERCLVIIYDRHSEIAYEVGRNLERADIEHPNFEASRSIIQRVRETKQFVCLKNALQGPDFRKAKSVQRLALLSVICVPIHFNDKVIGVLYVDNRHVQGMFPDSMAIFLNRAIELFSSYLYSILQRKELEQDIAELEYEIARGGENPPLIGNSPGIKCVIAFIEQVANTPATVIIQGESGTGKELVARAVHNKSSRKDNRFVSLNCGALQENLLESELFGYEKGAFTGATRDKKGWFETADGGTIFFDEISEMSPALQTKLLRILQTGEYSPVGSNEIKKCDVRIVAATNVSLEELIASGRFRSDLYYRLNILNIKIPPLRERKSDILLLANFFLKKYALKLGRDKVELSKSCERILKNYDYPGNVRELENAMQRVTVLSQGNFAEDFYLPDCMTGPQKTGSFSGSFAVEKRTVVEQFEKEYLKSVLKQTKGIVAQATRIAGMDGKNFYQKLKQYNIDPVHFK